ncbi:MFS transporter [Halobacteriales archaeon QS_6_71_20]|nr:MAG: MFS transporter [Halobacteriales archaeon QS_6_71_20]
MTTDSDPPEEPPAGGDGDAGDAESVDHADGTDDDRSADGDDGNAAAGTDATADPDADATADPDPDPEPDAETEDGGVAETGTDDAASLDVDRRTPPESDESGGEERDPDDGDAGTGTDDREGDAETDAGESDLDGAHGDAEDERWNRYRGPEADDTDADLDDDAASDGERVDAPVGNGAPDGGDEADDGAGADIERAAAPEADARPVPEPVAGDRDGDGGGASSGDAVADGDGAVTAAQKGMEAVSEGVGALGGGVAEGPEEDQEMPLAEHIEEMMRRLGVVFAIAGVVVVAVLLIGTVSPTVPSAAEIIEFLWDAHVGFEQNQPRVYGPLEFLLTKLKVASLAGLLVGLPVFVYETYRFMRPGLYPHERRYYLAAVPTSLVLGLIGVAFAHFIVLPTIFNYFISYTEESAVLAFSLRETFNLILLLMGYMAIVFQIPLFIQLAIMMGLVTREWLEDRRLLFWSAFVGLAFIVSPDPTGMSPIIVGATMIVLFEGTLALLRWTGN